MSILFGITGFSQEKSGDTILWTVDVSDVVVTAQYAPTDSRSAVHHIRTIKSAEIAQRGIVNLEQLVNQELNIRVSQDMVLGSSLNLQGISGQNIQIMVNGIPLIGRLGGNIDLGQINLTNIDRVEIVEGPLSVNFGTNALGGVINLITKKTQKKRSSIQVSTLYEGVGRQNEHVSIGYKFNNAFLVKAQGGYTKFNGFTPESADDSRSVLWNPKEQKFGGFSFRYSFDKDRRLTYEANFFNELVTNLGVKTRPQHKPYAFDDYYHTSRQDFSLLYEGSINPNYYLQTTIGYNNFERKKNTFRYNFEPDEKLVIPNLQDTTQFKSFVLRPVFASKNRDWKLNFQVGLDLHYENGFGKRIQDRDSDKQNFSALGDYALFGSLQYQPIENLIIQAGARAIKNTRYKAPLIPSLNVKYSLHKFTFRGSYAKGFRSPSLKELFFYFVDGTHFILGNSDLRAETSNNFQLSANWKEKYNNHRIEATVSSFYNHIQQKIDLYEYVLVDDKLVPAAELGQSSGKYAYFNQAQYKTLGGNVRLKYGLGQFDFNLGFAPIGRYNILSEMDNTISPFTFVYETNSDIRYKFPKQKINLSLYLRYNNKLIRYYQAYDDAGELVTRQFSQDGYLNADFSISKHFWKNRILLKTGVNNLLDVQNVNYDGGSSGAHAGGTSGSFPVGMGKIYFIGLNFDFNW